MTETIIPIPARLRSSVVGGHVTGAVDIYDDDKEMNQASINAAVDTAIGDDETEGSIKGRIKVVEDLVGDTSVDDQIDAKINALDATVSQAAGADGLALSVIEADGKITSVSGSIAANTYDSYGAASTVKTELLGDAATDYDTLGKLEDAIQAEATTRGNADEALDGRLDTVEGLIPSQAATTNQLADKAFVNSSISTATANFKGTKNLVTDLNLTISATESQIATALATAITGADNNDYAFVQIPTADATPAEIARVDRYKYNGTAWSFEYSLNNSSYTAAQWAAINSGITSTLVTAFNAKYDLPATGMPSTDMSSAVQTSLGKADSAYQKPSGGIPDTDLTTGVQTSLGKADTAYQLPSGGMPSTDMASAVQTSLGLADSAYQKPSSGIPSTDMTLEVQSSLSSADSAYQKPSGGIPDTDLSTGVQTSLGLADSAYQLPSSGIPDTDLSSAVQTSLGKADTALQEVPTASNSVLGGVKVGSNLSIDGSGVLSAVDTTYTDMAASGTGHKGGLVPDPGATEGTTKYLREDGTWQTPPDTTYSNFVGSGSSAAAGLVPAPGTTASSEKYLCEDGSWKKISDTSYVLPAATDSTLGGIKVGTNLSIDGSGVLSATDTTYESKTAASGGTDVSLVTTGEKYDWNSKYDLPNSGIPSTDLSSDVQASLGKADTAVQDVSGKADKLSMTGTGAATENNLMAIDANGNIKDSGKSISDIGTCASIQTCQDIITELT